jgi:hypothetical protein
MELFQPFAESVNPTTFRRQDGETDEKEENALKDRKEKSYHPEPQEGEADDHFRDPPQRMTRLARSHS